ncbi:MULTISPECIES: peptidylprolyl isomerase [unclassified Kitasatospora]|uniref:peptidylprolyl isomerase n=1 Tax=unclassified Kitasatospora TaxID=2633591 RepID=UPI00190FDD96|nr:MULTISPECIES: peptidylprolyl isomerase [unclassified Kitasatospora]
MSIYPSEAPQVLRKHWALLTAATTVPLLLTTSIGVADAAPVATVTCAYTPAVPADNFKGIPVFDAKKAAQPYSATLRTTQGAITFKALTGQAPCTTFSFRFLAEHDYFDKSHCHRLTTERIFVLQCGDPTGTGSGGPGYSFPDENLTGATYPAGTVAMANAGPNTNGSQFFFVWKDTKLSPAYTPFGQVTAGLDVLQKIAAAGSDSQNNPGDGYPNLVPTFKSVKISKR